jgi:hypothetical protein
VPAGGQVEIAAGDTYRSDRCPRECPRCHPPFESMLSYQLEAVRGQRGPALPR